MGGASRVGGPERHGIAFRTRRQIACDRAVFPGGLYVAPRILQHREHVTREDLTQRVRQEAMRYNISPDKMRRELEEHDGLNALAEQILLGKTLDFLKANFSVKPVVKSAVSEPQK